MIDSKKKIKIYDDTGSGDDFTVSNVLFEDDISIVCNVVNEWYSGSISIMIDKKTKIVYGKGFDFYYAKNY